MYSSLLLVVTACTTGCWSAGDVELYATGEPLSLHAPKDEEMVRVIVFMPRKIDHDGLVSSTHVPMHTMIRPRISVNETELGELLPGGYLDTSVVPVAESVVVKASWTGIVREGGDPYAIQKTRAFDSAAGELVAVEVFPRKQNDAGFWASVREEDKEFVVARVDLEDPADQEALSALRRSAARESVDQESTPVERATLHFARKKVIGSDDFPVSLYLDELPLCTLREGEEATVEVPAGNSILALRWTGMTAFGADTGIYGGMGQRTLQLDLAHGTEYTFDITSSSVVRLKGHTASISIKAQ
jgi:hypothetical protein